jgi:predicted dehydrogenase
MKRRKFILSGSLGAAGLGIHSCEPKSKVPAHKPSFELPSNPPKYKTLKASGGRTILGSNEKVVLALIGAGGWGTNLALEIVKMKENVEFKYICEVDDTRGGRAIAEIEKNQGFKPQRIRDMRKVFDDKDVNAVIVVTPEHWHALASVWACQAGKDVYVEKCVSHNLCEGQKMAETAIKYNRVIQSGLQNRSAPYVRKAHDYIAAGKLGDIVNVTIDELLPGPIPFVEKAAEKAPDTLDWNLWLGPAADVPYNISRHKSWFYYWAYGGGKAMTNECIHQLDMTRIILGDPGMPKSAISYGGRTLFDDHRDIPDFQTTIFDYEKFQINLRAGEFSPYMQKVPTDVRHSDTQFPEWKNLSTKVVIYGTKGMMVVGRMGGGWQVFGDDGKLVAEETGLFPLQDHIRNFLDCVRTGEAPNGNIRQAHLSSALLHYANMSYRLGSDKLIIDRETESVTNVEAARMMEKGTYRPGFEIVV